MKNIRWVVTIMVLSPLNHLLTAQGQVQTISYRQFISVLAPNCDVDSIKRVAVGAAVTSTAFPYSREVQAEIRNASGAGGDSSSFLVSTQASVATESPERNGPSTLQANVFIPCRENRVLSTQVRGASTSQPGVRVRARQPHTFDALLSIVRLACTQVNQWKVATAKAAFDSGLVYDLTNTNNVIQGIAQDTNFGTYEVSHQAAGRAPSVSLVRVSCEGEPGNLRINAAAIQE